LFYLCFEVTPKPDSPHAQRWGGAFVNCWIDRASFQKAERVARRHIEKQGWSMSKLDEAREIIVGEYDDEAPGKDYFEQALVDGEVFVFYTWPKDAQD
jgi:hypothetical protein